MAVERAEVQASVAIWVRREAVMGWNVVVSGGVWRVRVGLLGIAHEGGDGGHCCGYGLGGSGGGFGLDGLICVVYG